MAGKCVGETVSLQRHVVLDWIGLCKVGEDVTAISSVIEDYL